MRLNQTEAALVRLIRQKRKRSTGRKKELCSCMNYLLEESYNYKVCIHCVAERYCKKVHDVFLKDTKRRYQTRYNVAGKVSDIVNLYYGNYTLYPYTDRKLRSVDYKSETAEFLTLSGIFNLLTYANRKAYSEKYAKAFLSHLRQVNNHDERLHDWDVLHRFQVKRSRQEVYEYMLQFEKENEF